MEVLRLVAKGLSNREIAAQLTTTEATIKTHVSSILSKLHLANRVQATLYALQEGASLSPDLRNSDRRSTLRPRTPVPGRHDATDPA